jgi:hypothetical protein
MVRSLSARQFSVRELALYAGSWGQAHPTSAAGTTLVRAPLRTTSLTTKAPANRGLSVGAPGFEPGTSSPPDFSDGWHALAGIGAEWLERKDRGPPPPPKAASFREQFRRGLGADWALALPNMATRPAVGTAAVQVDDERAYPPPVLVYDVVSSDPRGGGDVRRRGRGRRARPGPRCASRPSSSASCRRALPRRRPRPRYGRLLYRASC